MRKLFVIMLVNLFFQSKGSSQTLLNSNPFEKHLLAEMGADLGVMNCFTDLGGGKHHDKSTLSGLNWKNSKPVAGVYILALYKRKIGLRLDFNFGQVAAYDSILEPIKAHTAGRYERNLSFKSNINEIQLSAELYPDLIFKNLFKKKQLSFYGLAGCGFFSFDPKTKLDNQWYSLQPLHTEGQGFAEYKDRQPYRLGQFNFSAGAGLKYQFKPNLFARIELNYRFLSTDYLDDVSTDYVDPGLFNIYLPVNQAPVAQRLYKRLKFPTGSDAMSIAAQRGNPEHNDSYFSCIFKIGFIPHIY